MVPLLLGPLGFQELLILLAIFLLMFGAAKLPQVGRGLGEGIRNFRKGLKGDEEEAQKIEEGPPKDRSTSG